VSIYDEEAMENIARYIIRASFSQERMNYIPEESKVSYQSKDGKDEKMVITAMSVGESEKTKPE